MRGLFLDPLEWYNQTLAEYDPTRRFLRYDDLLGIGAVKKIYRAFDKNEGREVAWNQISLKNFGPSSVAIGRLHSEIMRWCSFENECIIACHGVWKNDARSTLDFITEVSSSGNLRSYRKMYPCVSIRALKKWSKQILKGLEYLHTRNPCIIHRDLTCSNIFVNGNDGQVKIGDHVGFLASLGESHSMELITGTPEFTAPEVYEEEFTEKMDIYAFGMCLLEMATMETPYRECGTIENLLQKIREGIKPQALNKVADSEIKEIIKKCIAAQPRERPSASDLLKYGFFSELGDERR